MKCVRSFKRDALSDIGFRSVYATARRCTSTSEVRKKSIIVKKDCELNSKKKKLIFMEETKETRAARKEVSAMEEARAKCKKYSTETMVGKLLLAGLDPEVISSSGRDELINFTLTVEGFDVGVTLPKKRERA